MAASAASRRASPGRRGPALVIRATATRSAPNGNRVQRPGSPRTMRHLLVVPVLMLFVAGCRQGSGEKSAATILEDRAAWKKLAKGMTQDKVRGILGEPVRVESQAEVTAWYYQAGPPLSRDEQGWVVPRGALLFSTSSGGSPKLTMWREP